MTLANNGIPPEAIIVLVIVVLTVFANIVSWLSKMLSPGESSERDGHRGMTEEEGKPAPTQALKDFLEQLSGQTEAREPEAAGDRWEAPASRPQRPVRPAQRPAKASPRQAEARRPTPRPAEYAARTPRPAPAQPRRAPSQPRPAPARPRPATTPEETAILEEAEMASSTGLGSSAEGLAGAGDVGAMSGGMRGFADNAVAGKKREARQEWISQLPGNDIQNAIILMEILGPPRALKHHVLR